jgi:hypothetical protein
MTKNDIFLLDDYSKLNSGLFDDVTKIGDDINDIVGVPVEFEHILQTGFNNDKKKSNGKMYVSDVKSGSNIVNKMSKKFVDTDIVIR